MLTKVNEEYRKSIAINEEFSNQLQLTTNQLSDLELENKTLKANLDKAHKASKIRLE